MDTTTITLDVPNDILLAAQRLAEQRQTTLENLVTETLAHLVQSKIDYAEAHRLHDELVGDGFDLGLYGKLPTSRDELYTRR